MNEDVYISKKKEMAGFSSNGHVSELGEVTKKPFAPTRKYDSKTPLRHGMALRTNDVDAIWVEARREVWCWLMFTKDI